MRFTLHPFPELTSASGRKHVLVPTIHVQQWSERQAVAVLGEAFAQSVSTSAALVELALGLGCRSTDPDEVTRFLAAQLARGVLTAIASPDVAPRGSYPVLSRHDVLPDWDSAVPLAELSLARGSDALAEVLVVEVVTDRGVPVAGVAFEVRLAAGREVAGRLDSRGRLRLEAAGAGTHHLSLFELDAREWGAREVADRPVADAPPFEGVVEPEQPDTGEEVDDSSPEYLEHREVDVLDEGADDGPTPVVLQLRTPDGASLAYARLWVEQEGGLLEECLADDVGCAIGHDWTAGAGTLTLNLGTPLRFPPRLGAVAAGTPTDATVPTSRTPVVVPAKSQLSIVVARPNAYRACVSGWPFDARLLLPVDIDAPVGKRTEPLDVLAGLLALCGERPSWGILAVGHTDATGAADFNFALGALRAKSVHHYLTGDRAAWASHALAQATVRDLQAVLAWLATESMLPCHPGPIDGDFGPSTADALTAWRIVRGASDSLTPSWPIPIEDWEAVFDSYDEWVGTSSTRNLLGVRPSLAGRAGAWSRGEHEPRSAGGARRVELLLTAETLPDDLGAGDGFIDDAEYVYRTHEFEEIEPAPIDEGVTPYTGLVRKVAERGLRWLARGGVTVSHHVMVRHIVKRLIWLEKSRFRSGANVRKLCEQTLRSADRVTDQGTKLVFEKTFDRVVGTAGERIVRVVVRKGSGRIVTAFPELAFKAASHPMAGVFSIVAATTIHARWESYLDEQARLEEAREGWITEVADFFVGPATIARDEDYLIFAQIVDEETASAVASFEENVRREDGMFHTMTDDERSEFAASITEELAALSTWSTDDGDAGADETDGGEL